MARAAEGALAAVRAAPGPLSHAHFGGELVALIAEGLNRRAPVDELAFLDRHAARVRPSAALLFRRGVLAEMLGLPSAADDFRRCLELSGEAVAQLTSVRPRLGLARLALARGDAPSALASATEALSIAPRNPEALLLAATLHRAKDGRTGLRAFGAAHALVAGESSELGAAVGEAALLAGNLEVALAALEPAAGHPPSGPAALLLAEALFAKGELAATRELCRELALEQPVAKLGLLLCDLAEQRDSDLELDLEPEEAERTLRRWVEVVRVAGHPALREALRRAAPAVPFPWLGAALERL